MDIGSWTSHERERFKQQTVLPYAVDKRQRRNAIVDGNPCRDLRQITFGCARVDETDHLDLDAAISSMRARTRAYTSSASEKRPASTSAIPSATNARRVSISGSSIFSLPYHGFSNASIAALSEANAPALTESRRLSTKYEGSSTVSRFVVPIANLLGTKIASRAPSCTPNQNGLIGKYRNHKSVKRPCSQSRNSAQLSASRITSLPFLTAMPMPSPK